MVRSEGLIRNIFNIKKERYMIEKTELNRKNIEILKQVQNDKKGKAFTMAEILLSLTIIGVVAAITLPSLIGNINERTWNTQKKALHARMAQALALMPQLNGYGGFTTSTNASGQAVETSGVAQAFITEGLSKVLKITNVCAYDKMEDCGVASNYTTLAGSAKTVAQDLLTFDPLFSDTYSEGHRVNSASFNYNTKAAAFETQNGESIVLYYNPFCQDNKDIPMPASNSWYWDHAQQYMCANFVVDLNGAKGPNKVGQDISFITAIYPNNPDVVAPDFLPSHGHDTANNYTYEQAINICKNMGAEYRLPTQTETMAMTYNKDLLGGLSSSLYFWSGSAVGSSHAWIVYMDHGGRGVHMRSDTRAVRCVKR